MTDQTARIAYSLYRKNPDYPLDTIKMMVATAAFESSNKSYTDIYYKVLNRILEEKGFEYKNGKWITPFVDVENITEYVEDGTLAQKIMSKEHSEYLELFLKNAKLNSEEVFVMACIYKIESELITGKHRKILDALAPQLDSRKLTVAEIADLLEVDPKYVSSVHKRAMNKLETSCAIIKLHGTTANSK